MLICTSLNDQCIALYVLQPTMQSIQTECHKTKHLYIHYVYRFIKLQINYYSYVRLLNNTYTTTNNKMCLFD